MCEENLIQITTENKIFLENLELQKIIHYNRKMYSKFSENEVAFLIRVRIEKINYLKR